MDRIDHIRLLSRIAELGSFTEAAQDMGLSRPAVSKAVRELEDRLGARLLDRTTRSVGLTSAGRLLLADARPWLDQYDHMVAKMREDKSVISGALRLSVPASFDQIILAQIMSQYTESAPEVRLDIVLTDSFTDLITEGFDAALRITQLADSSLIARRICGVRNMVLASPEYLKTHGTPRHPRDLSTHICLEDSNMKNVARWRFQEGGSRFSIPIASTLRMNSPHLTVALAKSGHGIACAPEFAASTAVASGELIPILETYEIDGPSVYVVYPDRRYVPRRLSLFVSTVKTIMGQSA